MEGIGATSSAPAQAADRTIAVLGKAMREARAQAAALLSLVEQVPAPADGKGTHVNYRA